MTEHPCCKLPQRIELVGRPRAMDGSADLRYRNSPIFIFRFIHPYVRLQGWPSVIVCKMAAFCYSRRRQLFSFSISSSLLFSFPHSLNNLSAIRWRFMQSRGRQAEGRMIEGFGSKRFKLLLFLVGNDIVAFV